MDNLRAMVLAMLEHQLGDDDVWCGNVDPVAAAAIVDEHLIAGTPVEGHRLMRYVERARRT